MPQDDGTDDVPPSNAVPVSETVDRLNSATDGTPAPTDQSITEDGNLALVNPNAVPEVASGLTFEIETEDQQSLFKRAHQMAACFQALTMDVDKSDPVNNPLTAIGLICAAYVANLKI